MQPALLVLERLIDRVVRLAVGDEICRRQPVVVVDDCVGQRGEFVLVAENVVVDGVEDFL